MGEAMREFADLEQAVAEHEARWAVHNLASPAVMIESDGTYSHDGVARISAGAPLHVAATREDAEAWRADATHSLKGNIRG